MSTENHKLDIACICEDFPSTRVDDRESADVTVLVVTPTGQRLAGTVTLVLDTTSGTWVPFGDSSEEWMDWLLLADLSVIAPSQEIFSAWLGEIAEAAAKACLDSKELGIE